MSKPNPNSLYNSRVTQNQLIDSLTSHISLYNSHSHSSSSSPNPNPRSSILKWLASLPLHHRQSHLTAVDSSFVRLLLQMLRKLRSHGHGSFIILPDLPSGDLPSLCFRSSAGLLSRIAESDESERTIAESTRLFSSREGEKVEECSCSAREIDTVTVSEDLVRDLDRFVEVMDEISNGGFLRGEESDLGLDWVELKWLKEKGYYSMEAFVANRLEVALRLAWLNSSNVRRRGVKLKEKISAAGVAANVYWRKKRCVDWWWNLDAETRSNVVASVLGKAAKPLIHEILKGTSSGVEDEMWLVNTGMEKPLRYNHIVSMRKTVPKLVADTEFGSSIIPVSLSGKPASLADAFNNLVVLQDIIKMISLCRDNEYDKGKFFYSTLSSISTISDFILRKLRGFLMVLLLDCTKLELLAEGNEKCLSKKSKAKPNASNRKSKGKACNLNRPNPVPMSCTDDVLCETSAKDLSVLAHKEKTDLLESKKMHDQEAESFKELSSSKDEMEHEHALAVAIVQTPARKGRKRKGKKKITGLRNADDTENSDRSVMEAASSLIIGEDNKSDQFYGDTGFQDIRCDNSTSCNIPLSNSIPCGSANGPLKNEDATKSNPENDGSETEACKVDGENLIQSSMPEVDDKVSHQKDIDLQGKHAVKSGVKEVLPEKETKAFDVKEEAALLQDQENGNNVYHTRTPSSFECPPYEWPGVACAYFPPVNSHLPPATDRLHLEVGHNWQNHCQSFLPTIHQVRHSAIEGRCNPVLTRPLPMSIDWPPMVRSARRVAPYRTCNYDSGFVSKKQFTFPQGFTHTVQINATTMDDERKYSWDCADLPDPTKAYELVDECDSHWISEDEVEVQAFSGADYNQYFGGGVMYWNPSDHTGAVFSRPPSLSSDDSSWAWREADINRAVDDMVAFPSPYSTNGLTSPTASFCSPFDPLGSGNQPLGYVMSGNEVPGKVLHPSSTMGDTVVDEESSGSLADVTGDIEEKTGDSLPYPILRPIIISRSRDFKRSHDHKSPCVPPTMRDRPRIKRPPSPVVLSVPRAPRPPPPSPVSDSRKHRGFPTVRSGSSSPRHWGMRGWFHDGANLDEACLCMDGAEVVWPFRNNNISGRPLIQPLPAPLLQDRLIAISQLARDQEHPDVAFPLQTLELHNCPTRKASLSLMHSLLHDEIDFFCKKVATENMARKPYINWAVKRVTRSLQVLWPRSRTNIFGSVANGLSLPTSDVDLVVCLPPVRNLEPIKEAGILEGRNGIKETCLQHAARYLVNQDWVKNDSLKTVENTAIPIIMLVVEVPNDLIASSASNVQSPKEEAPCVTGEPDTNVHSSVVVLEEPTMPKCPQITYDATKDSVSIRIDISFKSPSHTGFQTTQLVKDLTEQFPAATPLALVLKQFLADRSLDQSYSGGLSSYCLVLLIVRFLQHEYHLGRPLNQNFGSLLMNFLYFFGNVFDPRQMRISVQGSGVYIKRERGCSIDPIHIDDPLFPTNNVGRNCFRIHQCIKAFSEAYAILETELASLPNDDDAESSPPYRLLPKIIPSIDIS
ncbi:uncharacterized protein LOC126803343 isoform X2 [Argentina anserina]|uniref:uncharacterized protein LOC126803343 isoform X2 n=1 Tax=Argentina anserina TaxID=57926 RepID=UPI0021765BAD|nr:uncharacterized protein LOC126803343 isoform X2 [Potentilla anserina]